MASGIIAIFDDVASLMDDVASASKIATAKTAGVLGDDLAVNAEKATGFVSSREIPVLWAITKGSFVNKLILIPLVFLLQFLLPAAIQWILVLGGMYLSFEGMEKVFDFILHRKQGRKAAHAAHPVPDASASGASLEKQRVKAAITTDFILSIEIVIVSLSTVLTDPLAVQIATVTVVACLATIGVYGLVTLVVRMDDMGLALKEKSGNKGLFNAIGDGLVKALPVVIKVLGVVGTIALLMVAGGLFSGHVEATRQFMDHWPEIVRNIVFGIVVGTVVFIAVTGAKKAVSLFKK